MTTTETRIGDYIEVYGGTRFYPLDPREDEIHIEDIAHALALTCRFSGHTRTFYSVAQHCVHVSKEVGRMAGEHIDATPLPWREFALWGLLHDAPEAYLNDIPRPLKGTWAFEPYRNLEDNLMRVVASKFGLDSEMPSPVKKLDNVLLATEARDLLTPGALQRWSPIGEEPLERKIQPWDWETAKAHFLARFEELTQ